MAATPPEPSGAGGIALSGGDGDGPTVAWLHGYTMDSSIWDDLWRRLPDWRHVGLDLPGHGRSRPLAPGEQLPDLALEVAGACAAVGARHLVALSFGTTVALQVAMAAGGALRSLVLGAPAVAGERTDPAAEVRYVQLAQLFAEFGPGPHMTTLWMASPPDIFRGARDHPRLWERLRAVVDRHGWAEVGNGAMRSLAAHGQDHDSLRRIPARTLVLLGDRDMPAFAHSAAVVAACVPACRALLVPDAGHLCLLERPETVAPLIDAHLREAESLSPSSS